MHIAIALNKYVVAIFGPTCSQEIELYDNGAKIVSDIECSPCYKRHCYKKDNCMSRIRIEEILDKVKI
jgi:heptosyltransferase-2